MKRYFSIITMIFAVAITGCKKGYLDQEVNPNSPSVTTPQYTLAGAEGTTAAILVNDYPEFGVWAGYWVNSGNYVPNPQLAEFQFSTTQYPGPDVWSALYANLTNYNSLQLSSAAVPADANFEAIAMIMKAYDFQQLVDAFGNVPYTQAFQPSTILFPQYDNGQDIYNDLVKQLDAAIALINKSGASATNPGTSDIIYGGNMTNWKKLANTLKLRMAIRQSGLGTNAAKADLAATANEGYIDASSEADANPGYSDVAGKQNPFYSNYGLDANNNPGNGNIYYRANVVAINIMQNLSDPRVGLFYSEVPTSSTDPTLRIKGNQLGNAGNQSNTYTSAIGAGLAQSSSQNSVIFSAYESLFLQAEAVARGWINPGQTAEYYYNAGITASCKALGVSSGDIATYIAQSGVAYPASGTLEDQVKAIITQKYISLNGYFNFEAYCEFLRTGYPALPQNPASADPAAISQTLPVRLPYPQEELNTNPNNFAKQGNINVFTSKIFWDTK